MYIFTELVQLFDRSQWSKGIINISIKYSNKHIHYLYWTKFFNQTIQMISQVSNHPQAFDPQNKWIDATTTDHSPQQALPLSRSLSRSYSLIRSLERSLRIDRDNSNNNNTNNPNNNSSTSRSEQERFVYKVNNKRAARHLFSFSRDRQAALRSLHSVRRSVIEAQWHES